MSVHTDANSFERIITMRPAFHRVHTDPNKNYGVHGVELRMVLKGPKGATQFLLFTGWYLPETLSWWKSRKINQGCEPTPADKGYHWSEPRYEGQESCECDLLPTGKCYYDGSGLNAEDLYQTLLKDGSDGVWRELETYYNELAKESVKAEVTP